MLGSLRQLIKLSSHLGKGLLKFNSKVIGVHRQYGMELNSFQEMQKIRSLQEIPFLFFFFSFFLDKQLVSV